MKYSPSLTSQNAEYGLGSEISTRGDVYSYGIILLEMITGKRPSDPIFIEGLNLHDYARAVLPDRVMEIVDPKLLENEEEEEEERASTRPSYNQRRRQRSQQGRSRSKEECLTAIVKIGVACSLESPQHRMELTDAVRELKLVKDILGGNHHT